MAGDEGAVDERAKSRVFRRLDLEQRVLLGLVEVTGMRSRLRHPELFPRRDMQDLPAEAAVAQQAFTWS